jgi:uncharacterized membrane protein required for colicin V production
MCWVDVTALAVIATFLVIGLFQGILWQVSRVAILLIAYGLSSHLAQSLSTFLLGFTQKPDEVPNQDRSDTAYYVACVLIFLLTLIVLSLLTRLLQHLVRKAGMSFFDRLGGGIVGMATGAVLVLVGLTAVFMFVPGSTVAQAAESSQSLKVSRWAVQQMGGFIPPELQKVFPEAGSAGPGAAGTEDEHSKGLAAPLEQAGEGSKETSEREAHGEDVLLPGSQPPPSPSQPAAPAAPRAKAGGATSGPGTQGSGQR